MTHLHFYSRQGCHLCELMLEQLLALVRGHFEVEVRDVDTRADWQQEYGLRVPVIELHGNLLSEYPLDADAIRSIVAENST